MAKKNLPDLFWCHKNRKIQAVLFVERREPAIRDASKNQYVWTLKHLKKKGERMADFCKQCSTELFGEDSKDLADLSTKQDDIDKLYCCVLCEGCGHIQVDSTGECVSSDCLESHS